MKSNYKKVLIISCFICSCASTLISAQEKIKDDITIVDTIFLSAYRLTFLENKNDCLGLGGTDIIISDSTKLDKSLRIQRYLDYEGVFYLPPFVCDNIFLKGGKKDYIGNYHYNHDLKFEMNDSLMYYKKGKNEMYLNKIESNFLVINMKKEFYLQLLCYTKGLKAKRLSDNINVLVPILLPPIDRQMLKE